MKNRHSLYLKIIVILSLVAGLLSGCGSPSVVKENYPLESVNQNGNSSSYVYRAAGETVPEVAADLAGQRTPDEMSPEDPDHMFLVYKDEYYHLQKDPGNPEDTLIEVDSESYVRQNYDSSFLQGYLTAQLIGSLFNGLGGYGGSYRGYTSRDIYAPKQTYHTPSTTEKKAAPPLTVEKKGSVIRRGSTTGGSTGGFFGGGGAGSGTGTGTGSRGSIERSPNGGTGSGSGSYTKPRTSIKKPSTRSGRGGISRRR
ncbi:hypothetical protein AWM70_09390 [Paenibacillus yonginensis]|uniref:DUF4247 domain-containing protein n=1 Tax=Paenibacillus yonginensis TaxID=1462996 RepID=A0A1B1N038_9BACL|nr:DUF4247 domain-containing protein [Paenibacillus yonginensis]ANS74778.1 hypothetical protein AWM70_09390 [Paenibacillus yonginensis]